MNQKDRENYKTLRVEEERVMNDNSDYGIYVLVSIVLFGIGLAAYESDTMFGAGLFWVFLP